MLKYIPLAFRTRSIMLIQKIPNYQIKKINKQIITLHQSTGFLANTLLHTNKVLLQLYTSVLLPIIEYR